MNRRQFLRNTALTGFGAAALGALAPAPAADAPVPAADGAKPVTIPPFDPAPAPASAKFAEPAREIPLYDDADVIVCGAGPAGVSAAIAAARAGARVRLMEVHGCLGGIWTAGLLTYIFDFAKPGLTQELIRRLDQRGARSSKRPDRFVYEPDVMKLILEEMCVAAGVKFLLHTKVAAAYRGEGAGGKRLTTIVTDNKSGRQAWRAPVFIDATGDGDLGAMAGCEWEFGRQKDCPCQPMTLNALAIVKDATALKEMISFYGTTDIHVPATKAFMAEIRRAGIAPSYGMPTLFHVHGNLVLLMLNHEYNVKPFNAAAVTQATVRARAEVFAIAEGLRKLGGVWEGLRVAATAEQIGVRDGRRILGRYQVIKDDLAGGARHDDAVARVTFGVDIHAPTREENEKETIGRGGIKFRPYDIPLRAMIARDVDGLMLAGRCISGDFIAHASYRVTGNAVAMGEAAGAVAAIAAQSKRLPHEVEWKEAQATLAKIRA